MNVSYQGTKSIFVVGTTVVMFPEEIMSLLYAAHTHAPSPEDFEELMKTTIKRANKNTTEEEATALTAWFVVEFNKHKEKKDAEQSQPDTTE